MPRIAKKHTLKVRVRDRTYRALQEAAKAEQDARDDQIEQITVSLIVREAIVEWLAKRAGLLRQSPEQAESTSG